MVDERDEISSEEFEEVRELARENNRILKSIQRGSRVRKVLSFVYFLIVLASMIYLYYFLQPYIEDLTELYNTVQGSANTQGSGFMQNFFQGSEASGNTSQ